MKKIVTLVSALALSLALLLSGCATGSKNINVGTGGNTGTYYAYTNAVGTILQAETGLAFNVVSTGGSVANINGIDDGDYNMAIVQNDTMINAYNDLDKVNFKNGAVTSFSVLGEVYSEVVQIVVRGDLKDTVKTLADLKGLRVSVGDAGSGVYLNAKDLLAAYDIDIDKDIVQSNLSVGDSADTMKDGKLDAFFFTAGAPTTAITELATSMDIFILSLEDSVMDKFIADHKIDGKYEVYAKMPITHDQYDFIPEGESAYTIGVTATYIVSNDLDEDTVYNMTKALWENTDDIAAAHAVGKAMNIDNAIVTIGNVPVHPGAEKYYKEVGLIK
ncbi:MAG: TAXI family TRAP transporter solute-binding subunit [Oscillospiraceae bacterium]|nr:TAXI family TRAP transporter solute-binding subunit [Oscillospiraceae bacterium]